MAAARNITKAQYQASRHVWNTRALELAEARGLDAQAARVQASDSAGLAYGVRSGHIIGRQYTVLVRRCDTYARCDCQAGMYGWPCSHAGAVLLAERERQAREERAAAADADRWALIDAGQW